jgi:methylase of polypeptide subunit release factors
MAEEKKAEDPKIVSKVEDELSEEELSKLPFANAEVVRLMKQNLTQDKMIRKEVKVAMNKFLEKIVHKVCERLDKYPYVMMEYSMFKEAVRPYENMDTWELEKERVIKYLDKIKADCDHLIQSIRGLE